MKKSRFTYSQLLAILKEAEGGQPVPTLCREHGMNSASFYKWRANYGSMDASLMKRMKERATNWLWTYNNDRPNMAICGMTPKQRLAMAS